MPASLYAGARVVVFLATVPLTAMMVAMLLRVHAKMPSLRADAQKASAALYASARRGPFADSMLAGCIAALALMAAATAALVLPVLAVGPQALPGHSAYSAAPASINFCEEDFVHSALVAEPVNFVSSLASYVPLAVLGLAGPAASTGGGFTRFTAVHLSILAIGIGSAWLHAALTSFAQGSDELPMLWWVAAIAYCMIQVCLREAGSELAGNKWLGLLVVGSVVVATATYIGHRENFAVFIGMFQAYVAIVICGLTWLCIGTDLAANHGVRGKVFQAQVFVPLATTFCWFTGSAVWTWILEMVGCEALGSDSKRWLHALWHFASSLSAFLISQLLMATHGLQHDWGTPCIRWFGAPYVAFLPHAE